MTKIVGVVAGEKYVVKRRDGYNASLLSSDMRIEWKTTHNLLMTSEMFKSLSKTQLHTISCPQQRNFFESKHGKLLISRINTVSVFSIIHFAVNMNSKQNKNNKEASVVDFSHVMIDYILTTMSVRAALNKVTGSAS